MGNNHSVKKYVGFPVFDMEKKKFLIQKMNVIKIKNDIPDIRDPKYRKEKRINIINQMNQHYK